MPSNDPAPVVPATHRAVTWIPCSQGGLWECVDCKRAYCSPPWAREAVLRDPCDAGALLPEHAAAGR